MIILTRAAQGDRTARPVSNESIIANRPIIIVSDKYKQKFTIDNLLIETRSSEKVKGPENKVRLSDKLNEAIHG